MNMPMKRPPVQARSRLAHEAAKWAGAQDRFEAFHIGVFRVFFEQGRDIGNIEILKELAAAMELDAESLHVSLKNGDFTAQVLADEEESRLIGVRAVPAFAVDGRLQAAGVQTVERLQELIARAASG
jgi:predicted DsbA family dithiol-disulfide isomerase